jgi:hypothetical protein
VAQLVEALCYKPGGRGFEFQWGNWNFLGIVHSGRTMTFEKTLLLTEMSTRNIPWAGALG